MDFVKLFSDRMKKFRGEVPDVYQTASLPNKVRVQIAQIIEEVVGNYNKCEPSSYSRNFVTSSRSIYMRVIRILKKERGEYSLYPNSSESDPIHELINFFLHCEDPEQAMDVVELIFREVEGDIQEQGITYVKENGTIQLACEAIEELNYRLREAGVGYQYESGQIISVQTEHIHQEIIKPVLRILAEKDFEGVNDEFRKAHAHYRKGRFKESLSECLKAFESTIRVIGTKRKWQIGDKDTAQKLISYCFSEKLIPQYLQSQYSAIRALLESGVPTIRNRESGHGQGNAVTETPEYLAAYMLNMTASTIIFLYRAHKSQK